MDKTIQSGRGLTLTALNESLLVVEQFLNDNYLFRRNELNGKLEFATIKTDAQGHPIEEEPLYRSLTQEALNSIVIRAKREQVCEKGSPKQDIME
jgi:hypothetical protein